MSFLTKTIGFMAVLCAFPAANAATARPSVIGNAASRVPTSVVRLSTSTSSTSSSLMANSECITAYTDCMKSDDACGSSFEECTNNTLFYAKRPQCAAVLMQCSTSGIDALFGTSNITAFSTKSAAGDYTYPTRGSVLGQLIEAAAIENQYSTSDCVKKYTSCLKKSSVCGSDFELCTNNTAFKKQKLFCESTLARCQADGIKELWGGSVTTVGQTATLNPTGESRVGILISEGADLASVNAVSTCYKVIEACFVDACRANPFSCIDGSTATLISIVDQTKADDAGAGMSVKSDTVTKSEVNSYLRRSCMETIGTNESCFITYMEKKPKSSDLRDEDNWDDIFGTALNERRDAVMVKIKDIAESFDKTARKKCSETISSCAMRACGDGVGAACYKAAFKMSDSLNTINSGTAYASIKNGCEVLVNTDPYCQYAVQNSDGINGYSRAFVQDDVFSTLFPEKLDSTSTVSDPIGAIASLNQSLAATYSDASLAALESQCQIAAEACVRSECGSDFHGCFRNRSDSYSSITNSGNNAYDSSMNKVRGVLDRTVVLGLCVNRVKQMDACKNHFAVASVEPANAAKYWNNSSSVQNGWIDAGTTTAAKVQMTDIDGNPLCGMTANSTTGARCDDSSGLYTFPIMVSVEEKNKSLKSDQIFLSLINALEIEAQATYNRKLTQLQNACVDASKNMTGMLGQTYQWVKFRDGKSVPKNYDTKGLDSNNVVQSSDLYDSFCMVEVKLQSSDPKVQNVLESEDNRSKAYFATGDAFVCGGWLSYETLETIAKEVGKEAYDAKKATQPTYLVPLLSTIAAVGGGTGGAFLGDAIQNGKALSSWTGIGKTTNNKTNKTSCTGNVANALSNIGSLNDDMAINYMDDAIRVAGAETGLNLNVTTVTSAKDQYSNANTAYKSAKAELEAAPTDSTKKQAEADAKKTLETARGVAKTALESLKTSCEGVEDSTTKTKGKNGVGAAIGAGVGAVALGGITWATTASIQKSNLKKEERAAYEEWMNTVGDKIHCVVGTEVIGGYGDIIYNNAE